MKDSKFLDRCFAAVIALALAGLFAAIALALFDGEPRLKPTSVRLQLLPSLR